MSSSVIPEQNVFLNAYEGNIFDFNSVNSKVYLTRKINSMLHVFGQNCIVDGFEILSYSITENNDVSINISAGKMIVDSTLIEYKEITNLTMNVSDFDDGASTPIGPSCVRNQKT